MRVHACVRNIMLQDCKPACVHLNLICTSALDNTHYSLSSQDKLGPYVLVGSDVTADSMPNVLSDCVFDSKKLRAAMLVGADIDRCQYDRCACVVCGCVCFFFCVFVLCVCMCICLVCL